MTRPRTILAVLFLGATVLALTGCDDNKSSNDDTLRPFVQVTPSGAEVVCTWNNWNGRDGNEWECEAVHD
ncbi:hypothetical protein M2280_004160 [Prescottella agglutinans]|uniref:Uncharacterized protein n=1 Tax=Prescottella agglutinans TaxID=1644129 RepID=A0ABT6MF44_9NOCA|nr:hypothetical protein [Prescottella agglutinans]